MKKLLAILLLGFSSLVTAQTEQTTPNLITSGTTHTWTGVTTGTIPSGCATAGPCPGGPAPIYDPATNTVSFSYNANAYVGQTIAINNALAGVGAGVKINGYNYSYQVRNMNGDDRQGGIDTFTVATALRGANNSVLLSTNQYFNTKFDWTAYSGTKTATTPIEMANATYLQIGVTGGDNGYWGGYFGPQIRNVNMSLRYTVDPCATNPAYATTCAGYNTVNVSDNLVPNPTGYATFGASINQSYAINQALALSGSGVMIHGFQWGYQANANGPYCNSWDFFGCWGQVITPSVSTNVNITDASGSSLYSVNRTYTNSYNTTRYQYLFPTSRNLSTLGNFNFTATTYDQAYIGDMWSKAVYTPDPCTVNPLSSTSCAGYQRAFTEQQCASNPLYSTQCVGYAAAYQTQQCNANQLYAPSCPGYAAAYLTYQCSVNPLYSTTCSGYEQAYQDQQCGIDPLFSTACTGYSTAYHDARCRADALYATDCVGYRNAYHDQQCSINPLYATDCTGYAQAYLTQQCTANPLFSTTCSGYAVAYKNQQCSLNPLYATDCTGYAAAYKNQQCTANPLYATDCAGYQQAYFSQQCSLNGLYDRTCPNYSEAYAKKMLLEQQGTASIIATAGVIAQTAPVATATVDNSGSVSTTPSSTGSTTVDKAIAAPPPTANSAAAPAAPVQLVAPPPPPAQQAPQEKKPEGPKPEGGQPPPQMAQGGPQGEKPQPTARQALAERRAEAAKKEAVEKGKNLANEMGKAANMEAQKQIQDVVVQAMGFTPGFDSYGKTVIPDVVGYKPFTVYNNQRTIDNRANQRMFGGSEARHNEMVDSQYNLGR